MSVSLPFVDDPWRSRIAAWTSAWDLPGLESRVTFSASARMRVSLGRCSPHRREIRIASFVLDGPPALLEEVVCHELAHVAAAEHHGPGCRAHGPEWKALMRAVGREPRARIPAREIERDLPLAASGRVLWEHRCPVCQAHRLAGRSMKTWRCGECRGRGLEGELVITRLGGGARSRGAAVGRVGIDGAGILL